MNPTLKLVSEDAPAECACTSCGRVLASASFGIRTDTGRRKARCNECVNAKNRERYARLVASPNGAADRTCAECGVKKCAAEFTSDPTHSRCKACHAERRRLYRAANPEKVREQHARSARSHPETDRAWRDANRDHLSAYRTNYNAQYYRTHYVARLLANARMRAARFGVPFDLESSDIFIPEFCPVLGIKMEIGAGGRGFQPCSPNLDRIVPSLGYVRGNVAVISGRANKIKSNATAAELERIAAWMRSVGAP